MEGDGAGIGLGADLVGLAGGDEENFGLLGLLVDRHLDVRGEPAHDEQALLVFDELLRALGAHRRLELVVAEEHLDLAAHDAALCVELVHGELRTSLHVRGQGREGPGQRERTADADRVAALRAKDSRESGGGDSRGSACKE